LKKLYPILLITILAIIPYLNSLNNDFLWDDIDLIRDNPDIREFKNLPKLFLSPFGHPVQFKENLLFYRPIIFVSYMVDFKIWGLNPLGYHLSNIIFHAIASILIFFILLKIFSDFNLSLISSLIFAVHPIHTESVTWISGRTDLLCTLLLLISLNEYLNLLKTTGRIFYFHYSVSIVFFCLSIFSKEMGLVLPLIISFYETLVLSEKTSILSSLLISLRRCLLFLIPVLLYLSLRLVALKRNLYYSLGHDSFKERLLPVFNIFFDYIKLLLFPINLNSLYIVEIPETLLNSRVIVPFLVLLAVFIFSISSKRNLKEFFVGASWFFITSLPISNIIPFSTIVKAEHFLYLPSVGFSIIAGLFLVNLKKNSFRMATPFKIVSLLLIILIIIFYGLLTIKRNYVWKNEVTIFEDQVLKSSSSPIAHNNLGLAYKSLGKLELAKREFLTAKRINPRMQNSYINLGNLFHDSGNMALAIKNYQKAIEINPSEAYVHNNLGVAYAKIGNMNEAVKEFEIASKLNPAYPSPYINLGNAYARMKKFDKAVIALKKAIVINPYLSTAHFVLGITYRNSGEKNLAIEELRKTIELDSTNLRAFIQLGDLYLEEGNPQEALRFYNRVLAIDQNNQEAKNKRNLVLNRVINK